MNISKMLPSDTFKDKTVLITGGGTGLGKSIGKHILELGGQLIITSRRNEVIEKTANEFNDIYPDSTLHVAGDVRNIEDVEIVINKGFEKFGSVDMLINNAAGNFISPTERLSANAFSVIIDIVLKGTCNYTLTIGKKWIDNKKEGTILNFATSYAMTGSGYVIPSAAAKGGVLTFTILKTPKLAKTIKNGGFVQRFWLF